MSEPKYFAGYVDVTPEPRTDVPEVAREDWERHQRAFPDANLETWLSGYLRGQAQQFHAWEQALDRWASRQKETLIDCNCEQARRAEAEVSALEKAAALRMSNIVSMGERNDEAQELVALLNGSVRDLEEALNKVICERDDLRRSADTEPGEYVSALELMRIGGPWLGAVRNRVKWIRCHGNGESVTWGSSDQLEPPLTIGEVEELAAEAVAADRNAALEGTP